MSKLIIINNQVVITEGIKSVIQSQSQSEIEVVASGEINDMIRLVGGHTPDILLILLDSTNFYIMDMISTVIEKHPSTKMIVMFDKLEIHMIKDLVEIGVFAFIEKQASSEELVKALNNLHNGHSYASNSVVDLILPAFQKLLHIKGNTSFVQLDVRKPFHLLTAKECIVLQLLADGHSNRTIAEEMGVSEKTSKNHVSSILLKMEVRDRTQAVLKAIKKGWVHLN